MNDEGVFQLAQQISDEATALIAGVETLDANNWIGHANKIESLNKQLQGLLSAPKQEETPETPEETSEESSSSVA